MGEATEVRESRPEYGGTEEAVPPGYKRTEVGVIPEAWEVRRVDEIGSVLAGKALAVNAPGVPRPYLRTANVFDGRIDVDDVLSMPMTDAEFERFRVRVGDVLLNEGQSLELVGRCAIYRGELGEPCAMQNQLLRFRPYKGCSGDFATQLFRHCQASGVFAKIALQTTSIAHLGASRFCALRVVVPPLPEQRAIARALSDVDDLISALDKLIEKKRAIKQATMQQLLTGRTRLPGFGGEWSVDILGNVAQLSTGSTPSRNDISSWGVGYSWLSIGDLHGKVVSESAEEITEFAARRLQLVPAGTLLMSFKLSIGRLAFAGRDLFTNEAICAIRCTRIDREYAYYALSRVDFGLYGKQAVKGVTLNREALQSILLPIPPLPEQRAIAAVLSDMDAEIEALERRRKKTRLVKQGMMQELLTGRIRLLEPSNREARAE